MKPPSPRILHGAALVVLGAAALLRGHGAAAVGREPFILTFWCAPPLAQFDDRRAAEIAAAGFNVVGAPCVGGMDPEGNRRALDVAARHGLEVWVRDRRFGGGALGRADWKERLRQAVEEYRGHPALGGYYIVDEPTAGEFADVSALVSAVREVDDEHLAYVNLLPDFIPPDELGAESYEDYVERFIDQVRPRLLSYDHYPFREENDRESYFDNLAAIRRLARSHDLPFMLIVQAMPHGYYRDPTEAEIAWQIFHALAFGARGISYFAYWTPQPYEKWDFHYGLIEDGKPTLHYFQAARLNRTVSAIAAELESFESLAVADSAAEIGVAFPIGPIDSIDGGKVTAGLFGSRVAGLAVLLVNRDYRFGVRAELRLHENAGLPELFDPSTRTWRRAAETAIVLAPGDARLLRWEPQ